MKKLLWLIPVGALGWLGYLIYQMRTAPPEVRFVKATRERLVSTLVTNGKVEPLEWAAIRAEREGALRELSMEKGGHVQKGAVVAKIDTANLRSELAAAEARVAQMQAEVAVLREGGRSRELAELEGLTAAANLEASNARREVETLQRLVDRKAATAFELTQAKERAARAEADLQSLQKRRGALVSQPDRDAAEARLREAQAAVTQAKRAISEGEIRAPISGVVYQMEARKGAWVRPGDPLAEVGVLSRVRVKVFVDEPELGGVHAGLPVAITWDAAPGKKWEGTVEKLPTEITSVGSRQVGEVICNIDNPEGTLIPGVNVTAEMQLQVVESAITLPKEALRRENNEPGIFGLDGNKIVWRPVKVGVASVTRVQVVEGVKEGDAAVLPSDDAAVAPGATVNAVPAAR